MSVVVTVEHGKGARRYVVASENESLFDRAPEGKVPGVLGTPAAGGAWRAPSISDVRQAREECWGRFSFGCQWLRGLGRVDEMYRTLSTWEVIKVEHIDTHRVWGAR